MQFIHNRDKTLAEVCACVTDHETTISKLLVIECFPLRCYILKWKAVLQSLETLICKVNTRIKKWS
jgi:hypothetical protein